MWHGRFIITACSEIPQRLTDLALGLPRTVTVLQSLTIQLKCLPEGRRSGFTHSVTSFRKSWSRMLPGSFFSGGRHGAAFGRTDKAATDRETERVSKENRPKWWLWSIRATVPYSERLLYCLRVIRYPKHGESRPGDVTA